MEEHVGCVQPAILRYGCHFAAGQSLRSSLRPARLERGWDHVITNPFGDAYRPHQGVVSPCFSAEDIMEVLQYEVVKTSNGFFIAVFDEAVSAFCRLSKETYIRFADAREALFSGNWTIA